MESKTAEEMDWGLKKEATKEQLTALRAFVDECWIEQKRISEEEAKIKLAKEALAKREATLKEMLEAAGMKAVSGTDCEYALKEEESEAGPQSEEDWAAFKGWMKAKYPKEYETFFKMHMGSLKAFVKKERAIAKDKGQETFTIPGIPAPSKYSYLKGKAKK